MGRDTAIDEGETVKTIGMLGGMSWHSSASYYDLVNREIASRLGGHHSAQCVMASVDFEQVRDLQRRDAWDEAGELLAARALGLQRAGADFVLICTNLMHKTAPAVEAALDVPLLHIADAVGEQASAAGHRRLGILGARWVMEETFYGDRLRERFGIEAVVPEAADRTLVDRVIFDELTQGRFEPASRDAYVRVIERLAAAGADSVVLACTEIGLLIGEDDSPLPLIDSTRAHALAAVERSLAGNEPATDRVEGWLAAETA